MSMHEVRVALSADFLRGFARIGSKAQRAVRAWIDKFREDPRSKSINYKTPKGMRDPKVRSVRITQKYRGIVIHPPKEDVYLLVWVDNHDEALDWARNKVFEVNRFTGTFQVYEPVEGVPEPGLATPAAPATPADSLSARLDLSEDEVPTGFLLAGQKTEDLLLFGVPEPLLPAVRALRTELNLDELAPYLPAEAADALYLLAAGYSVDQTLDELDRRTDAGAPDLPAEVDVTDFAQSLDRGESKRAFKLLVDDDELAAMLAAPLEQWRVFLHPSQAKLVTMRSKGSARVLGGAGTGKTVVAMHRARHLAKQVFNQPGQRILVTTFTRNLAADIRENLRRMCGPEFERIEVKHLQEVARDILSARGLELPRPATRAQSEHAWTKALAAHELDYAEVFYKEEWSRVVQAQDATSEADYFKARRVGRGKRLTRKQRRAVWKVLAEYRRQLDLAGLSEHEDRIREARLALAGEHRSSGYCAVIADEVQDFRTADLLFLRALVEPGPNDIFVVGDPHQRIYGHKASLGRCGISIRGRRSRKLRINYRTTQQIRNWAVAALADLEIDDLDEGTDKLAGERSLREGLAPRVLLFEGIEAEVEDIAGLVRSWVEGGVKRSSICITARTQRLIKDSYAPALASRGVETVQIQTDRADKLPEQVRIASMHRVKGLEFPRMILVGVQAGTMPYQDAAYDSRDEKAKALYDEGERKLLYVAATRARDVLVVTGCGQASPFCRVAD